MRERDEETCRRRKGLENRGELPWRRFALLPLGLVFGMVSGLASGAAEAADIDAGSFALQASAPGILVASKSALESAACGLTPARGTTVAGSTVGGLTSMAAPSEIVDINANMNIQGLQSNNANTMGTVAAASIQFRLEADVDFVNGASTTAGIAVSRFCMETTTPVSLSCGDFDVLVALDPSVTQAASSAVLTPDQTQGGSFTSNLNLNLALTLTNSLVGVSSKVVVQHAVSYASSGQWAYAPGSAGMTHPQSYWIDTDCDDVEDTLVEGTTDLFPGWTPSGQLTEVTFTDRDKGGYLRLEPPSKGN